MMGWVPAKKYRIKLSEQEREELESLCRQKNIAKAKYQKASALLLCDEGPCGPSTKDEDVKIATGLSARSIERLRARCCEVGPLGTLERKPRKPSDPQIVTGEVEARITALNCSPPPTGHARWTLRLLAKRLVEIEVVETISHTTVGEVLKKVSSSPGVSNAGAFRPKKMPPS